GLDFDRHEFRQAEHVDRQPCRDEIISPMMPFDLEREQADDDAAVEGLRIPGAVGDLGGNEAIAIAREEGLVFHAHDLGEMRMKIKRRCSAPAMPRATPRARRCPFPSAAPGLRWPRTPRVPTVATAPTRPRPAPAGCRRPATAWHC